MTKIFYKGCLFLIHVGTVDQEMEHVTLNRNKLVICVYKYCRLIIKWLNLQMQEISLVFLYDQKK